MTGCKQGERKAQEAIYERFAPKMYALCLRYAGSPDDAQDVLQNGFIKMFRKLDDFRGEGSFEGWLRRIMVTSAIEYCRKNASWPQQQSITETIRERPSKEKQE